MTEKQTHIALVDDDEQVVDTLSDHLEHIGYRCSKFTKATDALNFLLSVTDLDLLITDVRMPDVSGLELVKNIRDLNSEIPVILITGYGDMSLTLDALRFGATDYIGKPFDISDIKKSITRILNQRFRGLKYLDSYRFINNAELHYRIPAKEVNVVSISTHIADFLYNLGFYNLTGKLNFGLALNEALINSNDHGNLSLNSLLKESEFNGEDEYNKVRATRLRDENYANKILKIDVSVIEGEAKVKITDEGKGFDVSAVTDIDPLDIFLNEDNHGRGITLMQLYTDNISYNDLGNEIIITKTKQD